jgi:hypothetical protein
VSLRRLDQRIRMFQPQLQRPLRDPLQHLICTSLQLSTPLQSLHFAERLKGLTIGFYRKRIRTVESVVQADWK